MKNKLRCILLIDDDEPTNYINEMILNSTGRVEYIYTSQTAMEALDYLTSTGKFSNSGYINPRPNIIFLDINMPGIDGWDFLEEYRNLEIEGKEEIAIIMLTNSFNPDDEKRADETAEIAEYRNKPLSISLVGELLDKYSKMS